MTFNPRPLRRLKSRIWLRENLNFSSLLDELSDDELEQLDRCLMIIHDVGESPIRVIPPKGGK
jgi:hypothetical protein